MPANHCDWPWGAATVIYVPTPCIAGFKFTRLPWQHKACSAFHFHHSWPKTPKRDSAQAIVGGHFT
jgi:hypothetical protein